MSAAKLSANGLNPCCNGIYLIITAQLLSRVGNNSLNPCCNGIYLIMTKYTMFLRGSLVLILVVMEYT